MKATINSVLEKKLEELESLLEAFTLNDNDPYLHKKIELQVTFAKTLLAAEISSRRQMDAEGEQDSEESLKLRCMAKRLTDLEEALKTNQLPDQDNALLIEPETNGGSVKDETGSVNSWVESCLNASVKAEEEVEDEQWPLFQDASPETVTFPSVAAVKEELVVGEVKERMGRKALICFGLIGLVGGLMISLVGYIGDTMKEDNLFLVPT